MKRSDLVSRLGKFGLLLTLFCVTAPLGLAQGGGDIAELLSKHDEALKQHDLNGVLALFAPGAKTVVLGTGPGEKYQGAQEIREAYGEIFKDFDKGTLTHNCYWKDGAVIGNTAWMAAMCKFSDARGEKKREYEMNVSAVAQRQGGKWQFVMLHYSNLVGPPAGQ